jgi:hypothetical protein
VNPLVVSQLYLQFGRRLQLLDSQRPQAYLRHVKMALQQPNRPSKLFMPHTPFSATSHPSLPSAVQQTFTPPTLHVQQPSIQASFTNPFHSPITHTPSFRGRHRQNASVAQFSLNSPAPHHPGSFQPALPPFPQSPGPSTFLKSRRTASISLGGPPKALLGGPQRKPSPLAGQQPPESAKTGDLPATQLPRKKVVVNLPEESGPIIYEDKAYQTPPWTRRPLPYQQSTSQAPFSEPFDIDTREIYPTQEMRQHMKAPFKILLPSQVCRRIHDGTPLYLSIHSGIMDNLAKGCA